MTEQEKWERLLAFIKWLMGGLAVVAAFLLIQPDIVLIPAVKVALGAFLAFAAYVNPATIVRAAAPGLTAEADREKRIALEAAYSQPKRARGRPAADV